MATLSERAEKLIETVTWEPTCWQKHSEVIDGEEATFTVRGVRYSITAERNFHGGGDPLRQYIVWLEDLDADRELYSTTSRTLEMAKYWAAVKVPGL